MKDKYKFSLGQWKQCSGKWFFFVHDNWKLDQFQKFRQGVIMISKMEMSSSSSDWQNFCHWLHRNLSKWQLLVQSVTKILSIRHFPFTVHWNFWAWLDCEYTRWLVHWNFWAWLDCEYTRWTAIVERDFYYGSIHGVRIATAWGLWELTLGKGRCLHQLN